MYYSSPERSFKGTSSEEDQKIPSKDYFFHQNEKKPLKAEPIASAHRPIFPKDEDQPQNNLKCPRLLKPLEINPTRRRKRRKHEVLTSSSMSYSSPEPTQRRKFGSCVPQLNFQSFQSSDRSLLSINPEDQEKVPRDLDIDELVETLSIMSNKDGGRMRDFRKSSSSRGYQTKIQKEEELDTEETSRTFRIDDSKIPWNLKPTNGVTDFVSRRSEVSMCPFNTQSNASTQVNMRSSLLSLQNPREVVKSQERFPFTISETSTLAPRYNYKTQHHHHLDDVIRTPNFQVSTAEVIYENKNCRCSSSSDSTNCSVADKNIVSSP